MCTFFCKLHYQRNFVSHKNKRENRVNMDSLVQEYMVTYYDKAPVKLKSIYELKKVLSLSLELA